MVTLTPNSARERTIVRNWSHVGPAVLALAEQAMRLTLQHAGGQLGASGVTIRLTGGEGDAMAFIDDAAMADGGHHS